MPSRRHLLAAAPALALVASPGAPPGPTDAAAGTSASASAAADAAAYPVTIAHAHGETTIEKAPTRVATIGWADADVVAALGVVPVGAPKITWGGNAKGSTDWFDASRTELGVKDGDIARYDDSAGIPFDDDRGDQPRPHPRPDPRGCRKEDYDKLTKIAPVVAYTDAPWGTPWQDQLEAIGTALGKPAQAAELLAATTKAIDDAVAANPQIKGRSGRLGVVQPHRPVDDRALHDRRPAPADAARVRPGRLPDRRRAEQGRPVARSP